MKVLLCSAVFLFVLCLAGCQAVPERPQVLLICLDTLRADHLHCMGREDIQTPHIDALARDGVLFSRCQSTAPWTLPAVSSVYTGLIPYRHGAIGGDFSVLNDSLTTMAEYFSDAGYRTAGFVTVDYLTVQFGLHQGFDKHRYVQPGIVNDRDQASNITSYGRRELQSRDDGALFLLLHYFDVHAPYLPPTPFDHMYYEGNERAPGESLYDFLISDRNETHWAKKPASKKAMFEWLDGVTDPAYPVAQYAAGVSYVDDHVGRVIARTKELGVYDDLLIVLFADHGEHLGEHSIHFTHYRPYQETLHVPLIIKYPANRNGGTVVDQPVSVLDMLPTVLDACGIPVPDGLDGRSLNALAAGRNDDGGESLLLSERGVLADKLSKSLVEWPWKLLYLAEKSEAPYRLYNLEDDPGELDNLIETRPGIGRRLRERLWEIIDTDNPSVAVDEARPAKLDEDARRRLKALGY